MIGQKLTATPLVLLLMLFLSACTQKIQVIDQSEPNIKLYEANQDRLSQINGFDLKGKVGVQTGSEGGSARINWEIEENPFEQFIELYGPFGGGRLIIESNHEIATLKDAKGNIETGQDTESLLANRLGWRIPFEKLRAWAKGMPSGPEDLIKVDQQGLLLSASSQNWTVEYEQYQPVSTYTLPRKLVITSKPGVMQFYDKNGDFLADQIRIKVIIQSWQNI